MVYPTINSGHTILANKLNVSSHVFTTPTYSEGDYIFLFLTIDTNVTSNTPSGFTVVFKDMSTYNDQAKGSLWYKIAGASEPGTYTVTTNTAEQSIGIAFSVSNCDGIHSVSGSAVGNGSNITALSVTTTIDECLILRCLFSDGNTLPHTLETGHTELQALEYATTVAIQYINQATAGSSGNLYTTMGVADEWGGRTVALKPSAPTHYTIVREGSGSAMTSVGQSMLTFNYTLINPSNNNRLVIVGVNFEEDTVNSRYVSGVKFNGVIMTQLNAIKFPDSGLQCTVAFFYILDDSLPSTSGSKQVVISLDGACTDEIMGYIVEYSGVQQSVPDDSDVHEKLSAGNTSVTLTPNANGSVGVLVCGSGGTTSLGGSENNLTSIHTQLGVSSAGGIGELLNQSGTFTFGYNNLTLREGCIGAVWQPALIASSGQKYQMML